MFGVLWMGCTSSTQHQNQGQTEKEGTQHKGLSSSVPNKSSDSIHILFPKKGDTLKGQQSYTLKWSGGHDTSITIFIIDSSLESEGVSVSISDRIYNVSNNGLYKYKLPDRLKAGTYKVKIGHTTSGYFKIIGKE